MITKVHHINILVRDLQLAVSRYQAAFAIEHFEYGDLPERGVKTARFRAGESWIVLLEPIDAEGVPARHLAEHGEGLFLLSLGVDSMDKSRSHIDSSGGGVIDASERFGLDGWKVLDLDPNTFSGAVLQLTED